MRNLRRFLPKWYLRWSYIRALKKELKKYDVFVIEHACPILGCCDAEEDETRDG